MNKEFGNIKNEYSNSNELAQPNDPLNSISPDINICREEYWQESNEYSDQLPEQFSPSTDKSKEEHSRAVHKKLVRKMVYTVASAVTIVTISQAAIPEDSKSIINNFENALEEIIAPAPQEPLLAAQTIVFSGNGILTKEEVDKEFSKYDLSEPFAVVIEDGYNEIGEYAFNNCTNIVNVDIPDSVTSFGHSAFAGCDNLVIDVLHTAGRSFGRHVFNNVTIGEIVISNSLTCEKNYHSPSFVNVNIQNVSFEPGITSIPDFVFCRCSSITAMDIPNTVIFIGEYAFSDCDNLISVNIPDSVTSFNANAFSDCENLSDINIPDSITFFGNSAFAGCDNLVIDVLHTAGRSFGRHVFNNVTIGEIVISDSLTCEKNYHYPSFVNVNIQNVSFEPGITSIPDFVFCRCSSITAMDIPNTVIFIGEYAFSDCDNLISVNIPDSVTSFNANAFSDCENLSDINIPDSITFFGNSAFAGCENLVIDVLHTAGRSFGRNVFNNVTIGEIVISDSLTCEKNYHYPSFVNVNIQNISFEPGITSIPDFVFCRCSSITSVDIPNTVTSIGENAFNDCPNLISTNIPDSVTFFGNSAFANCESLVIDVLHTAGRTFGRHVFNHVTINEIVISDSLTCEKNYHYPSLVNANIQNVSFEPGITSIPDFVFCRCSSITSVNIPNTVTSIGEHAFSDCVNLVNANIPDSVTSFNANAFSGCNGLVSISIPDSVTFFGNSAFANCENLVIDVLHTAGRTFGRHVFNNVTIGEIVISDSLTCEKYYNYPSFVNVNIQNVNFEPGITSIPDFVFCRCSSITSVDIPNTVTSIGENAFNGCENLISITIPSSVTSFGKNAFANNNKMTLYVFENSSAEAYAIVENIPYVIN